MLDQIFRNMTPVVKNLLILNVLFFIAQFAFPDFMYELKLSPVGSEEFKPWQLATHFFMHSKADPFHLFFNMFALILFGVKLESHWGAKRFLFYYLTTAVGAAVIYSGYINFEVYMLTQEVDKLRGANFTLQGFDQFWINNSGGFELTNQGNKMLSGAREILSNPDNVDLYPYAQSSLERLMDITANASLNGKMLGASGAVFGVLAAFGYLFPNTELMLLFPPIPIKAKFLIIGYIGLELFLGFTNNPEDHVAHFAHLGGALIGILLVLFWQKDKRNFY